MFKLSVRQKNKNRLKLIAELAVVMLLVGLTGLFFFHQPEPVRASTSVQNIAPTAGISSGNTLLRIFGTDFNLLDSGNLSVTLGTNPCTSLQIDSNTQLSCRTAAGSVGTVDVVITDGVFSATLTDGFTYLATTETDLALYYDARYSHLSGEQVVYDLAANDRFGYLGQNELVAADEPAFLDNPKRFNFDGVDDMIDTTLHSDFSDSQTIEVWFKRANTAEVTQTGVGERLVTTYQLDETATDCGFGDVDMGEWSFGGNACTTRHALGLQGTTVQANSVGSGSSQIVDSQYITSDWWHHAALTYDSTTGENKIYINSSLHGTYTQTVAAPSAGVIKIGTFLEGFSGFEGDIATVRIYGRALSDMEITTNFDLEKSRFGFTLNQVQIINFPENTYLGAYAISDQPRTVSAVLPDITFVDRRSSFTSWSASIAATKLVSPISEIPATDIAIDPTALAQTVVVGSGNNNYNGTAGYFSGEGVAKVLFENTGNNGGGQFQISPEISVDIPAFARAQSYSGTLTISVS